MSASKVGSSKSLETGDLSKTAGASGGGQDNNSSEGIPERPSSPDAVKCAICLGDVVNRSCSNTCAHQFCFGCLLEWSKVKPECPLCKSSFRSIYHNFRGAKEYDEYVVPAPTVPHLSIRFTASAGSSYRLSPFIRVLEARASQSPSMAHRYDVDITRPNVYHAPPVVMSNPFSNLSSSMSTSAIRRAEYFGDLLNFSNDFRQPDETGQMRGYQNRRRRYDRDEWVQPFPFGSAAQSGSFPSVEYIRSHPTAITRLRTWLYRELSVLMGIHRNRDQLGFIYDLITHLLGHYDIRSRDFRESVSSYLGARTSHFQHELYHFLLSGMSMDEYDREAEYPSANNGRGNAGGGVQRNTAPEIITITSDDEDADSNTRRNSTSARRHQESNDNADDEVILLESSSDEEENYPFLRPVLRDSSMSSSLIQPSSATLSSHTHENSGDSSSNDSAVGRRTAGGIWGTPDLSISSVRESLPRDSSISLFPDPDMPVLEPQVFSMQADNHVSSIVSNPYAGRPRDMLNTIDLSRATAATTTVTTASTSHVNYLAPSPPSPSISPGASFNNLHRDSSTDRLRFVDAEFDLDLNLSVEHYSSPPPPPEIVRPDFPILRFRDFRSWRERSEDRNSTSDTHRSSFRHHVPSHPSSSRTEGEGSAFVAYEPENPQMGEELSRPPRPSCIYDRNSSASSSHQNLPLPTAAATTTRARRYRASSPSPAFRIDLYPHGMSSSQVMDLSRSAGLIPSNSSSTRSTTTSPSSMDRTNRPSCPPPIASGWSISSTMTAVAVPNITERSERDATNKTPAGQSDSDELECLGSFPIEKKPPLAVITLSSDDDDDDTIKAEKKDELLNVLSTDDESALLDEFISWRSTDISLLDPTTPPLPENDTYLSSNSSSPALLLPIASSSRSRDVIITDVSEGLLREPVPSTSKSMTARSISTVIHTGKGGKYSLSTASSTKCRKISHSPPALSPRKRSRRMVISSSSEESFDEDADSRRRSNQTESYEAIPPSPVKIPKKRKFIEATPSPPLELLCSSEDSNDSSNEDEQKVTNDSKISKKRDSSSKKKHKSKSKKSKKSKKNSKHKHKERKRSRSRSGGGKYDKAKSNNSTASSTQVGCSNGASNSADGSRSRHSSNKLRHNSTAETTTTFGTSSPRSVASPTALSSLCSPPLARANSFDFEFCYSRRLDLGVTADRSEDVTPIYMPSMYSHLLRSQISTNIEESTLDLRIPSTSMQNDTANGVSTVDTSAIFDPAVWFT